MKLNQQEYEKIVTELENAFAGALAKSEEADSALAKAGMEDEHKEAVDAIAEEHPSEEAAPEAHEEHEAEESPAEEAEEHADPEAADEHGYSDEELAALHQLYDEMPQAELETHLAVLHAAMAKYAPEASAEEAAPEAQAEDMDKCGEMHVITKSEPSVETELMKSEIANKDKEIEDLKKSVEELVSAMGGFLNKKAPARKAVTELQVIAKSETETAPEQKPLSQKEIFAKLNQKASEPSLAKSDRELINLYTLKKVGLEKIQHLLK